MNQKNAPLPISIRIGYEWTDRYLDPKASPPKERYHFLKAQVDSVVTEARKRASSRKGVYPICFRVGRMRALHGGELLPRFRDLCDKTDIMLFDITGENPNVMLELGMAFSAKASIPGRVMVCKQKTPDGPPVPSDLKGYLITFFSIVSNGKQKYTLRLEDIHGFRAALRAAIIEIAREREMWRDRGIVDENAEGDRF